MGHSELSGAILDLSCTVLVCYRAGREMGQIGGQLFAFHHDLSSARFTIRTKHTVSCCFRKIISDGGGWYGVTVTTLTLTLVLLSYYSNLLMIWTLYLKTACTFYPFTVTFKADKLVPVLVHSINSYKQSVASPASLFFRPKMPEKLETPSFLASFYRKLIDIWTYILKIHSCGAAAVQVPVSERSL